MSIDPMLQEILSDAKLVASHGARSGSFGTHEPLYKAIRDAEAQGSNLAWSSPQAGGLQQALSAAIRTIRPVSLYDLKAGWRVDVNKHDGFGVRIREWSVKWLVILSAACLMFICASLTLWQQRATSAISQISSDKTIQQARAFEDLMILINSIGGGDASRLADPSSPISLAFRQKQREIEAIEQSMWADQKVFHQLNQDYLFKSLPSFEVVWAKVSGGVRSYVYGGSETIAEYGQDATGSAGNSDASGTVGVTFVSGCDPSQLEVSIDDKYKILTQSELNYINGYISSIAYGNSLIQKIRCDTGLEPMRAAMVGNQPNNVGPGLYDISIMKDQLDLLGLWLLPGFYGMLGALIYHVRAFLSNLQPNPSFTRVVLRVGLSGFAGIAIGWFWLPEDGTSLGVPELTITPLTIAFLMGFAIDAFVSFLDRVVTLMNRWTGNLGAPT